MSTIERTLIRLGWRFRSTRYCQHISARNIRKRCRWALKVQVLLDAWYTIAEHFFQDFFTDESQIQLQRYLRKRRSLRCSKKKTYVGVPKYVPKVMVWAGISLKGACKLVFVPGKMNAAYYQRVLSAGLFPAADLLYSDRRYRIVQDKAGAHIARSTVRFLQASGVRWHQLPSQSPGITARDKLTLSQNE